MLDKLKESIKSGFSATEENFRIKFESKHGPASVERSEDGAYIDQDVEAEWQLALKEFNAEEYEKFIDNQW